MTRKDYYAERVQYAEWCMRCDRQRCATVSGYQMILNMWMTKHPNVMVILYVYLGI